MIQRRIGAETKFVVVLKVIRENGENIRTQTQDLKKSRIQPTPNQNDSQTEVTNSNINKFCDQFLASVLCQLRSTLFRLYGLALLTFSGFVLVLGRLTSKLGPYWNKRKSWDPQRSNHYKMTNTASCNSFRFT